jgi:hypothetical protein
MAIPGSCVLYKEECVYNTEQDGRRPAAKAYVAALEDRIRVLEKLLEKHGLTEADLGADAMSPVASSGRVGQGEVESDEGRMDSGLDRLKVRSPPD